MPSIVQIEILSLESTLAASSATIGGRFCLDFSWREPPMKRIYTLAVCAWLTMGVAAHACDLRVPLHAIEYQAVVVGMSPPEETKRQTEIAMRITGGAPTPRYMPLPRVLADFRDERGMQHRIISAVTDGNIPAPGASVVLRSRYLDPDDPCQFVPWTVKPIEPVS
jgi:hypothetical protein